MAKGLATTAVPDPEHLGKKSMVCPQIQEVSDQFFSHFLDLKDPRVERMRDHKLIDIIAIAILAVISGASGWQGMKDYGQSKQQWSLAISGIPLGNSLR